MGCPDDVVFALITGDGRIAVVAAGPHASPNGRWLPLIDTPKPPDTATHTHVYTLQLIDGEPTVVWVQREWTTAELAAANRVTLAGQIGDNIATLLATVDALNLLTERTNADINTNPAAAIKQVARECKTVARQTLRIARVVAGRLDTTNSGS
jgi:hypothetical protein